MIRDWTSIGAAAVGALAALAASAAHDHWALFLLASLVPWDRACNAASEWIGELARTWLAGERALEETGKLEELQEIGRIRLG